MGLDMYLRGNKYKLSKLEDDDVVLVDGFERTSENLSIGQWRKHAALHHLIVNTFADGVDDCSPIPLNPDDLRHIAKRLRERDFPPMEDCGGFFFGDEEWWQECCANADADADIFEKAANWITDEAFEGSFWHSVEYQASW